ncbi:kinase-like domain-containing protein [Mycena olivaceomarginata]|nr:kinase-like domain-containing protein [Mycena olivaceomarginata]
MTLSTYTKRCNHGMLDIERLVYHIMGPHPRIVPCLNPQLDTVEPLLLAKAENGDLRAYLHHHAHVPFHLRAKWALQITEGIAFIHGFNIVWADCTPDNVLLTADLDVMLCDFGGSATPPLKNVVCPPTRYIDPSVDMYANLNGRPRVDIFAFGCLLLELLTFDREVFSERPCLSRGGTIPDGRLVLDLVPFEPFKGIIENCWDNCYADGKELHEAMTAAYNDFMDRHTPGDDLESSVADTAGDRCPTPDWARILYVDDSDSVCEEDEDVDD